MSGSDTRAAIEPHNLRPAAVWSSGGEAYEEISHGIADAIEHCVRRLDPRPGERILDVATGTGRTARRVAEARAEVTAIDIAEGLLAVARAKAGQAGLSIAFRTADAERLPFADSSFDGVISTFGVMFASRPEAAAAELARVCRPGGRLALAVWEEQGVVARMFGVMRPFMPPPPPGASPPPSPFAWGGEARLRELLGGAFELGFERDRNRHRLPDGAAFWEAFVRGYGPTKTLAESLDPVRRDELKAALIAFHEEFRDALGLTAAREYLVVRGIRRCGAATGRSWTGWP